MSYIQQSLTPSEKVIYTAQIHWFILARPVFTGIATIMVILFFGRLIAIPFLLMTIILLAQVLIYMYSSELAITDRRVIAKFGWISRKTYEVRTTRIEGIHVEQGILGRILGFGTISVVGIGGSPTPIPLIANPLEFKKAADTISEKHDG